MRISVDAQKAILIFGISGILFWLTRSSVASGRKPKNTTEGDQAKQKADANIVMDAYMRAARAGEPAALLEQLNRTTEEKYGMRVYKKADGKYYVMDTKGNDIKLK